jgi:UDP-N-acetylmuramate dehydrogenase
MITVKENIPLAPFTTFGIGGPARFLVQAGSAAELREALLFARQRGVAFYLIGGGSNLLVSDSGFDGLAILVKFAAVRRAGAGIAAEAGADLTGLVRQAAAWGLSGMESLAGIPGLLGGAVRGNAGAYGGSIGEVCATVRVLDSETLDFADLDREECRFAYRSSRFKRDPRLLVVSAQLALASAPAEEIRDRVEATLARRAARHLQCDRSAGSFFMNPMVSDAALIERFQSDQQVRCRDGRIPAGWLIDQTGLRQQRIGAAMVSSLHANYLINTGGARAEEIVTLARLIKERVRAATGVQLQEEVSCLGFPPAEAPGSYP